jgi:serine-protein kinase ATM
VLFVLFTSHFLFASVPFRLTQNIVDGLGPTGVEGGFTRAAETTMRVLKYNTSALLTILTSIAADPLYMWTLSPVKARAKQLVKAKLDEEEEGDDHENADDFDGEDSEHAVDVLKEKHEKEKAEDAMNDAKRNDQATHVIAKVHQKLQGYEDGTSGEQQGVEGQIQLLINQARDIGNLAVMYPGWAPWL